MKKSVRIALLVGLASGAASCRAERLPLWEAGAGIGLLNLPDYRGADVRKTWVLPLPYLVYRGKFLKADRNGVRASLFESARLQINLSVNGTLPVSSRDDPLRSGMPDLRPAVEFGPNVDIHLWRSEQRKATLDLRAPLRAAVTVESSPKEIGWLFSPHLSLSLADPAGLSGWKFGMQAGPVFNSRRYNRYFYSVSTAEARPGRPAYAVAGGYAGAQLTATLSHRFRHYWLGAFVRYDNLAGAVFNDSPLVQRRAALSAGIGLAWVFGTSSTLVEAAE